MSYFSRILAQFTDFAGNRTSVSPKTPLPIGVGNSSGDAFGRLRTGDPFTLIDSKMLFDNHPHLWDDAEESGASTTSTHTPDEAAVTLAVALNTAGKRTRQTFRRVNYQPGKSQLIFMTFVLDALGGGTGITRGIGLFDDNNGIFLRDNAGTIQVVRRTNVTGTPVDNAVAQASWNLDVMDGTGSSGITVDWTKSQILVIDFEWLGVGRVRVGLNIDGVTHYVHEFLNANVLDKVYMSSPNLPLRYQIENDGTGAASELDCICSTIISEGGEEQTGTLHYASTAGTHVDANTADTLYAIVGIKLKSTTLGQDVEPVDISIIMETNDDFEWNLIMNPTVAGTFAFADHGGARVQVATGDSTNTVTEPDGATNGRVIAGGFADSSSVVQGLSAFDEHLGAAIDGTPDEMVLCVRPLSANADVQGSITWRESS